MKISHDMDLYHLAERMGFGATLADARNMRDTLVDIDLYRDTDDVPDKAWLHLVETAASDIE